MPGLPVSYMIMGKLSGGFGQRARGVGIAKRERHGLTSSYPPSCPLWLVMSKALGEDITNIPHRRCPTRPIATTHKQRSV